MFHIRDEGEQIGWGFNFYPLRSRQFGFVFIGFGRAWWCRYSKQIRRIFLWVERDPNANCAYIRNSTT